MRKRDSARSGVLNDNIGLLHSWLYTVSHNTYLPNDRSVTQALVEGGFTRGTAEGPMVRGKRAVRGPVPAEKLTKSPIE